MKKLLYAIKGKQSGIICESFSLKEAYHLFQKVGEPREPCVGWICLVDANIDLSVHTPSISIIR